MPERKQVREALIAAGFTRVDYTDQTKDKTYTETWKGSLGVATIEWGVNAMVTAPGAVLQRPETDAVVLIRELEKEADPATQIADLADALENGRTCAGNLADAGLRIITLRDYGTT
jgi:hypothetical protein